MKTAVAGLIGSLVVAAASLSMVCASPTRVGTMGLKNPSAANASASTGAFQHPEALNINGIRIGMSRDEVHQLHLDRDRYPLDLKYDATAHVSFVAGLALNSGSVYLDSSQYGKPMLTHRLGDKTVSFFQAGQSLVITRFKPPSMDSRSRGTTEFAITTGVGWIPYEWGHDVIAGK